jgi:hypothetical protein
MAPMPLTAVQHFNFSGLSLLRDAARADDADACCRFGLGRAQLQRIGELSPQQVMQIVVEMGDEALFLPRADLPSLLAVPATLMPVLASARSHVVTRPDLSQPGS